MEEGSEPLATNQRRIRVLVPLLFQQLRDNEKTNEPVQSLTVGEQSHVLEAIHLSGQEIGDSGLPTSPKPSDGEKGSRSEHR
tara:strand:- start:10 stop:255 length:246 start_codon:yes stop_codon:yes gene_type:complete